MIRGLAKLIVFAILVPFLIVGFVLALFVAIIVFFVLAVG